MDHHGLNSADDLPAVRLIVYRSDQGPELPDSLHGHCWGGSATAAPTLTFFDGPLNPATNFPAVRLVIDRSDIRMISSRSLILPFEFDLDGNFKPIGFRTWRRFADLDNAKHLVVFEELP